MPPQIQRVSRILLSAARSVLQTPHRCSSSQNLSPQEQSALTSLRADRSLVVRPADKGNRWVILDRDEFDRECLRLLADTAVYTPVSAAVSPNAWEELSSTLLTLRSRDAISCKELAFLLPPSAPRPRLFGILPKLHKDVWPTPAAPPGRPIVSDVNTDTSGVARLIEFFLAPLVRRTPSYLRDSGHLIALLRVSSLSPASFLCSFDVRALYTSIPIPEGIARVQRAFLRFPDSRRPDEEVLSLLRLCLSHNDFVYADRWFLQTSGVAMGKAFGGSFANLYLAEWETSLLRSAALRPRLWLRFQDDVFFVWDHGEPALEAFHHFVNAQDPHIQVDLLHNADSIRFLDLLVYRTPSHTFGHRVGFKDSDSHRLLPKDSHHPAHVHRSVLFSQILRFATLSSSRLDFNQACNTVFPFWRSRGVTRSSIRSTTRRVFRLTGLLPLWQPGFHTCNGPACSVCTFGAPCTTFRARDSEPLHPVRYYLSCASTHTVYVVRCRRCGLSYVGQSSNPLRQRITEHLRSINGSVSSHLADHFRSRCGLTDFSFFAIDRAFSLGTRTAKESRWISTLRSSFPLGLNSVSSSTPVNALNLLTFRSDCTDRLNALVRRVCWREAGVSVRLCYKTDRNLRSLLT